MIDNHVQLHDHFAANRESLLDVDWLTKTLWPHCKYRFLGMPGSRLRLIQHPREFAQFLITVSKLEVIRSYIEIGLSTGGSWRAADAYFRACFPGPHGFQRSVGYDIRNRIRDYDIYLKRFPTCEFRRQSSRRMKLNEERFDVAFVDGQHLEPTVLNDFRRLKDHCRWIAFHDIVHSPGVASAWETIKPQGLKSWEFVETTIPRECRCGIGLVQLN